ncbi:MAG: hypothetical protein WCF10_05320 [Polyangiales bacterium]
MSSIPISRSRPNGFQIHPASQAEARKINGFIQLLERLSNAHRITTPEGRFVSNSEMGFSIA